MRIALTIATLFTLVMAFFCLNAQATQIGETSAKISRDCTALTQDGAILREREAWSRLTTGLSSIVKPPWAIAMVAFVLTSLVTAMAALRWPKHGARSANSEGKGSPR